MGIANKRGDERSCYAKRDSGNGTKAEAYHCGTQSDAKADRATKAGSEFLAMKLRIGQKPTKEPYRNVTNVVASNRMEALDHKWIPPIGAIKGGYRLVDKTCWQVPAWPKWWIVEMDWQPLKLRWHNLGAIRVARWVKAVKR